MGALKNFAMLLDEQIHVHAGMRQAVKDALALPDTDAPIEIDRDEAYLQPLLANDELEELHEREVNAHQKQVARMKLSRWLREGH